jgi:hypothetical protein
MIKIVKRTGETTLVKPASAAPPEPVQAPALSPPDPTTQSAGPPREIGKDGHWNIIPGAVRLLITDLETRPFAKLDPQTEVWVAFHLGLGSVKARDDLVRHNVATAEWNRVLPWLARPDIGDSILPDTATWEVHRTATDAGPAGWATLTIGQETWDATAKSPWAAFAICLLKARLAEAFKPRTAIDDPVRPT